MKMRLLAIGLMSLFAVNVQASSLREIIAQNPGTCALVGYAVGSIIVGPMNPIVKEASWRGINTLGFEIDVTPVEPDYGNPHYDDKIEFKFSINETTFVSSKKNVLISAHHKTILIGLITSAVFGGLAFLAAKK